MGGPSGNAARPSSRWTKATSLKPRQTDEYLPHERSRSNASMAYKSIHLGNLALEALGFWIWELFRAVHRHHTADWRGHICDLCNVLPPYVRLLKQPPLLRRHNAFEFR